MIGQSSMVVLSSVRADADTAVHLLCAPSDFERSDNGWSLSTGLGRDRVFSCFLFLILELLYMLFREVAILRGNLSLLDMLETLRT